MLFAICRICFFAVEARVGGVQFQGLDPMINNHQIEIRYRRIFSSRQVWLPLNFILHPKYSLIIVVELADDAFAQE
jgi:hypothetical protein